MREGFPTVYDSKATRPADCGKFFCEGETRTKQSFREECDINRIMARYLRSGVLPPGVGVGRYGDFSAVTDFHEAQQIIKEAEAQFASMPAKVRDRFKNDPGVFLAFVGDPANAKEARELGLLKDEPVVPVANGSPKVEEGK